MATTFPANHGIVVGGGLAGMSAANQVFTLNLQMLTPSKNMIIFACFLS